MTIKPGEIIGVIELDVSLHWRDRARRPLLYGVVVKVNRCMIVGLPIKSGSLN
jgi:hypothetical protein